jgi:hypothetical protein
LVNLTSPFLSLISLGHQRQERRGECRSLDEH